MLKIEDYVNEYSHIRLATQEDNADILKFYKEIYMQTGEEGLSFDRGDDFFAFYKTSAKKYWTFLFLNDDQSICGVGTILRHERYIDGKLSPLAYFCDLRISPVGGRRSKVQWRKLFKEIIEVLPKLGPDEYCEMAYTAILSDNQAAINSLTKSGRGFNYRYIDSYNVYSIISTPIFVPTPFRTSEISFSVFKAFYLEQNDSINLTQELEKQAHTHYRGIFDGQHLVGVFSFSHEPLGRSYRVTNVGTAKKFLSSFLKMVGRPEIVDGHVRTLEIQNLTIKKLMSQDSYIDITRAIFLFLKEERILNTYHICNIYTAQVPLKLDFITDGITINTKGHMFEIHSDDNSGLIPLEPFRFEGSFL